MKSFNDLIRNPVMSCPIPEPMDGSIENRRKIDERNRRAQADYMSNPGRMILESAQAELKKLNPQIDFQNEEGTEALKAELKKKEKDFEEGVKEGSAKTRPTFDKVFEHLMNWNIPAAIMAIPIVGTILATLKHSMGSLFTGKPISPFTAFKQDQEYKSALGAAEKLGIKESEINGFVATVINSSVSEQQDPKVARQYAMKHYEQSIIDYAKANPLIVKEQEFFQRVMNSNTISNGLASMEPYEIFVAAQENDKRAKTLVHATKSQKIVQDRADAIGTPEDTDKRNKLYEGFDKIVKTSGINDNALKELLKLNVGSDTFDVVGEMRDTTILVTPPAPTNKASEIN